MQFNGDGRSRRKKNINLKYCEICGNVIPRNTKQNEKRISPEQYIKSRFCSKKCKGIHHSQIISGLNNPRWKGGGKRTENKILRDNCKYKKWRLSVFQRDNFKCKKCNKGGILNAHHIENFNKYKNLIYIIDNGITFCENCHKKFHKKYGRDNNNLAQLLCFIK